MSNAIIYQEILLNYFVQQSVAHGAMLFAAILATFTFLRLLKKNSQYLRRYRRYSALVICMLLLMFVCYVTGRLAIYGNFSHSTIEIVNDEQILKYETILQIKINNTHYYTPENATDLHMYSSFVKSFSYERSIYPLNLITKMFANIAPYKIGPFNWGHGLSLFLGFIGAIWIFLTLRMINGYEEGSRKIAHSEDEKGIEMWLYILFGVVIFILPSIILRLLRNEEGSDSNE